MLDADPGRPQMNVADGKAELVITLFQRSNFSREWKLAGPVPADLQSYVSFAGGVGKNTHNADAAKLLIKFITSPAAAPILKAKALEPR